MIKIRFLFILLNVLLLVFLVSAVSNQCLNGCTNASVSEGRCYQTGERTVIGNTSKIYCDISGKFLSQKSNGAECDNNFQCINDLCSNGRCVDIYREVKGKEELIKNTKGNVTCEDECTTEDEKKCSDINNYQVCGRNYEGDGCLEWSSSINCPIEYDEQTKCRTNNTLSECARWCGDGVCSNIQQCYGIDDPWGGQGYGFCYQETCLTCSQDCGNCIYGVQGANGDAICGISYDNGGFIRRKIGNIDVSSPEIMKTKINKWIYSNPYLYHQTKLGQFDAAVQTMASHVWNTFFSSGYCRTDCPTKIGNAPTSARGILNGQCGLCSDYANLWLSLLRTMNVPSNRVYVLCYQTVNPNFWGHCVTAYKSDSGQPWILDYGNIYSSLNQGYACKTPDWAHWGNDDNYGWASFKNIKCE